MCLYIIGLIDIESPKALINPRHCNAFSEILDYIEDHELISLFPSEDLQRRLLNNELIRVGLPEYRMEVLIAPREVMECNINRYVPTGNKRYYFIKK